MSCTKHLTGFEKHVATEPGTTFISYFLFYLGYLPTFNKNSFFNYLVSFQMESQSSALQRLKIKEKMLEAKLYKHSFVALKNKSLDLSSTEKVSEV